ncbi:hypothetical protein C5N14_15865 [Micromonospora sp. MW-13]|uniref:DUF397 domain-containing protein n=1 Tax=unclassified Micromonospora TaxID=2617518 RepID=UPI000E4351C0|nr:MULTISPECIES: DUF397 domain-containing protein [unclassified Micromonospora]MCX4470991.1 DUF397 domain-containing protein [Micromonospora sp. NBC_01655]RGC67960.1 hypothetical protein C5N14_15865 [Micromonospora sp. MW-13]
MTTLTWKKSTRSNAGGDCVEVATPPQAVMVRDSKDRQGPVLSFSPTAWTSFVDGLRR